MAGIRILIVDDEGLICEGIRSLITRICDKRICGIHTCTDPSAADGLIERYDIDLVLTDIRMDELNGIRMIQQLQKKHDGLKFIIISGYERFQYAKEAMKLGVLDFLLKPVKTDELAGALNSAIGKYFSDRVEPDEKARGMGARDTCNGWAVARVIEYIRENYQKDISLAMAANIVSMNYSYFSRLFKERTGVSFTEYLMRFRMDEACRLLKEPCNRVNEVSSRVGFASVKQFNRLCKTYFGVSPGRLRQRFSSRGAGLLQ